MQSDDIPVFSGGIAELALVLLHPAEIAVRTGELGIETDGFAIPRLGLVRFALRLQSQPQAVVGVGCFWIQIE